MNAYVWLIRREFWENRAIWMVPALLGAALTLAALFGKIEAVAAISPEQAPMVGPAVLLGYGVAFFVVMCIYCTWYLLECLYADRKDRSVLFWKSLPISDAETVLAKLFTGVIAVPLTYFAAADVSTLLMAFIVSIRARAYFGNTLWQPDLWLQLHVLWLYIIVTMAIWYLPFTGWLLLVSAWAKRAVILWLILPPLALYWAEWWFFGSHVLGGQLSERTVDYLPNAFHKVSHVASVWQILNPVGFLSSPETWIGLGVGAALIAGAVQLRLRRTEL
jgi:ABC-2 type transport system permease protein